MNFSDFLNDKVILAIVSLVAYVIAYQYELGYLSFFDVGSEFIQVDYQQVLKLLVAALTLLIIVNSIENHADGINRFYRSSQSERAFIAASITLFATGNFLQYFVTLKIYSYVQAMQWYFVAMVYLCVAIPRDRGRRDEKNVFTLKSIRFYPKGFFAEILHPSVVPVLLLTWAAVELAEAAGYSSASRSTQFAKFNDGSERFVVGQVGSSSIIKFTSSKGHFDSRFQIIPTAELKNVILVNDKIGPLLEEAGGRATDERADEDRTPATRSTSNPTTRLIR